MMMKKFREWCNSTFEINEEVGFHYYLEGTYFTFENYRFCLQNVNCHTGNCRLGWVVKATANPFTARDKAIRVLRNNVPIKRIIRHAIASRMHLGLSMENIKLLEKELRSWKQ